MRHHIEIPTRNINYDWLSGTKNIIKDGPLYKVIDNIDENIK